MLILLENPVEELNLFGTTFNVRKLTDWDDLELRRKATKGGVLDECLLCVLRWQHVLTGWQNLLDKHGKPLEFNADIVAVVKELPDGRKYPSGVGPALGQNVSELILQTALAPVIEAEKQAGNSGRSSPKGDAGTP